MNRSTRTLLIVDDSPEDRELYRRYLLHDQECSYTILETSLGQEGLNLWQQHHPDAMLLDYCLPDLDGMEILARLRSLIQQPCLPVVIITGRGSEAIALQAIKAGAQDYLIKEVITPESLRLSVSKTITTIQLQTQLQQQIEQEQITRRISQQIHQSLELDQILHTAVTEVRHFLQTDRVLVFRLAPDDHHTVIAESVAGEWRSVLHSNIYDPCFTANYIERYQQGRVMVNGDIYDGSLVPCHVEFLAQFQVRANLVVPILRDEQLWGLLIAHHCVAPRSWQLTEVELLQQLAIHLGIALQQANTYIQLEQQSEARYRAIVEDQTDLIVRYLPDTTIQFANRAYCRYFGVTPEEITGNRYEPVIFEEDRERVTQLISSMSVENPTVTIENRVVVNGEIRWTQWINRMLFDDQWHCKEYQSVGRDITHLKQAEAQLRHSSEQISLANAELARAVRLKDQFLANMSHELRTPLNSILGLSEALLEGVFGSLTDKQRQFLQTIEQSGQHLLALIDDILDLSKIESDKIKLELRSVSLATVCASSLNFVKQQAHQKQIQLTCEIDPTIVEIEADERRLLQVLVNLLTNAVKFTPDGGQVKLDVRMNSLQQAIEFQVTDSGIGIAPENLSQIFQPFIQVDSSLSRRYPGTGLGLSIVQRIVDLHGGSIRVESELGQGSCFTVILPWHPLSYQDNTLLPELLLPENELDHINRTCVNVQPPIPATALTIAATESFQAPRVLLAEDNEANIKTLISYLEIHNFQILLARNGLEAVQRAKQDRPNLILMDIQMPVMDGLEATRQIRADARTCAIPIIALTALAMPGDLDRCLDAGANAYLAKPVRLKQLLEVVTQHLPNAKDRE